MRLTVTNLVGIILLLGIFSSCKENPLPTADKHADAETVGLFIKMKNLAEKGFMVGHQDALAYGVGWWNLKDSCDMYRTSGEFPAVYGWDLGDIHDSRNLDSVSFENMKAWMIGVHEHGGINTISFHLDNPVDGNSSWDTSKITSSLLPGGENNALLNHQLDLAAAFLQDLKTADGKFIPIIFRPWHEHNGNWFWWGRGNASEEEYIQLFRYTVEYFQTKHQIHHLLYAFSPDRSRMTDPGSVEDYLYAYPGDDVVDLLGWDNYKDVRVYHLDSLDHQGREDLAKGLAMISGIAAEKGKLLALTETGSEAINDSLWFTERILDPIKNTPAIKSLSYVLFWRNARPSHHYMTYPGHITADNFRTFLTDSLTLTLKDIGTNFDK